MSIRFSAMVLVACACARSVHADRWGPVKHTEFHSAAGTHRLKIDPDPDWPDKPGHCRATLYRGNKEVWSRYLINNHAPVRVFVADSGKYVVTMDEWHSVGELPVVIYGRLGRLVRVHSTDSLGLAEDVLHIKRTVSSYWWNEDSVSFFGPDDETFIIRLHWGKWIVLDLRAGYVMQEEASSRDGLHVRDERKWKALQAYRQKELAARAIAMLSSTDAGERKTAALICGQEKLTQAIPRLRELLNDKESFATDGPAGWTRVYFVRQAAKEALEAMGQAVEHVIVEEPETR